MPALFVKILNMGIRYYVKHPVLAVRKVLYYALGNTIGRIYYPPLLYKSRWFNGLTALGWEWVTRGLVNQKLRGINSKAWWPVTPYQKVGSPDNIIFHVDDINNFQMPGSYFQAFGRIVIGKGTYIAQNVGIITANHNLQNLDLQAEAKPVSIGEKCWIGMNSVILPGVELGPHTIVGAGSVVTKSFVDGHYVIAGNPAKVIRHLS